MKKRKDIVAKKKKKYYVLMAVIAILMISVTGATYAFFSLTAVNNTTISGTVGGAGITLTVTKELPSTNPTNMVPQLESTLTEAVGSTYNCIDDLGNVVCQVYKARVQNVGAVSVSITGTIAFSGISNLPNLKWKRIESLTEFGDYTTYDASTSAQPIEESEEELSDGCKMLNAGSYTDYYIVIWVDEIDQLQTDKGTFTASIQFDASTGCGGSSGSASQGEVWVFNETLSWPSTEYSESINFTISGTTDSYDGFSTFDSSMSGFYLNYVKDGTNTAVYSFSGGWNNESDRTIVIDLNSQSVSLEFLEWFYANATKQS